MCCAQAKIHNPVLESANFWMRSPNISAKEILCFILIKYATIDAFSDVVCFSNTKTFFKVTYRQQVKILIGHVISVKIQPKQTRNARNNLILGYFNIENTKDNYIYWNNLLLSITTLSNNKFISVSVLVTSS